MQIQLNHAAACSALGLVYAADIARSRSLWSRSLSNPWNCSCALLPACTTSVAVLEVPDLQRQQSNLASINRWHPV